MTDRTALAILMGLKEVLRQLGVKQSCADSSTEKLHYGLDLDVDTANLMDFVQNEIRNLKSSIQASEYKLSPEGCEAAAKAGLF